MRQTGSVSREYLDLPTHDVARHSPIRTPVTTFANEEPRPNTFDQHQYPLTPTLTHASHTPIMADLTARTDEHYWKTFTYPAISRVRVFTVSGITPTPAPCQEL